MIEPQILRSFFAAETVAVIGASDKAGSVGQGVYANLKAGKFGGRLLPINSKHSRIQGDAAARSLREADITPDLVVVCTPAATIPQIARDCGELGVGGMIVISAGFRESGEPGRRLESEVQSILREYPRLRMVGPNCLGVLAPHGQLNASFSATMPQAGGLAVISQSGALCTAIIDWSRDREIGFSGIVSVGNMLDVGFPDLIEYFAADARTAAILLYIESLSDSRHFLEAARACSQVKPIIALKSGRFAESSHAAMSHTGAMAGVDVVYDAAFRRAGIERVFSFDELFDCAKLLQHASPAVGSRLAIVTNAGGPGIMASDAWLAQRGQLARLSSSTIERLNQALPPQWSHGNPVDVLGDAQADRYEFALKTIAADPEVDATMVILTPQSMTDPVAIARTVAECRQPAGKPLLAVWMGGPAVRQGRQILEAAGIPVYVTPEQSAQALAHQVSSGKLRAQARTLATAQRRNSPEDVDRLAKWHHRLSASSGLLGEIVAKQLLAEHGIPSVPTRLAQSASDAARIATEMGYPVVLKVLSPEISHKTDIGGVELNLANSAAVEAAYHRILDAVTAKQPAAHVEGVTVQPMIGAVRGVELLLGATRDPIFGPVIVIGSGGVTAEIQHDLSMQLTPIDPACVESMLRDLRIYPILQGYRGRPGVDLRRLTEVIVSFSRLVEEYPEITAVEINPLLSSAEEIVALDARVIVGARP